MIDFNLELTSAQFVALFPARVVIAGDPKANNDIVARFGGVLWLGKGNRTLKLINK